MPPTNISSNPPTCHTGRWRRAGHLGPSMAPTFHNGGTVGGGGFPPTVLSRRPKNFCIESEPSLPSSLPPAPYTPLLGIPAPPPTVGKDIPFVYSSPSGGGVYHCIITHNSTPWRICQCIVINPTEISSPHYKHFTMTLYLYWYVNPSPVIHRSYNVSDWVPAARKGRQTTPNILLTFVLV